jgi:hypothetical protein
MTKYILSCTHSLRENVTTEAEMETWKPKVQLSVLHQQGGNRKCLNKIANNVNTVTIK